MQIALFVLCLILLGISVYLYRELKALQAEQYLALEARLKLEHYEQKIKEQEEQRLVLEAEIRSLSSELNTAHTQQALLEKEQQRLEQALEEKTNTQAEITNLLEERFEGITTRILEERSEMLHRRSEDSLKPLREDLKRFAEQVDKVYKEEARERHSLQNEIRLLVEHSNRISSDANNLTQALRGNNKVQGNWGEMILEDLLQKSGLEQGIHYVTQERHIDKESNKTIIPDVIVNYPNGGRMIIDSKVNLKAYMDYVNAQTDDERKQHARTHVEAVRSQIKNLREKHYPKNIAGSPDFVILFIPNEPAYILALKEDSNLWQQAYEQKILLMNTSNLMATLKLAEELWRNEKQRINVQEIFRQVGELYDSFVRYIDKIESISQYLDKAQQVVEETQKSMSTGRGNLLSRFERLKKLGAKTNKQLQKTINDSKGLAPDALEDEDEVTGDL